MTMLAGGELLQIQHSILTQTSRPQMVQGRKCIAFSRGVIPLTF
jgi:hypothetical protein